MLNQLSNEAYKQAERRNQLNPDLTATLIAKMVGESGEALDAHLEGREADIENFNPSPENFYTEFEAKIKNTTGDELADVILFALIIAKQKRINIDKHIELKMKYNAMRP